MRRGRRGKGRRNGKRKGKKWSLFIKGILRDFPGGPVVKDLPSNVGDVFPMFDPWLGN